MAQVDGMDALLKRLEGISGERLAGPIGQALLVTADTIKADAQVSITTNSVSGKAHVPSLPGEPPNEDTGHLATNIESALVSPLKAEVSSNAEYAAALEFGTSKMAERPYMRPALEKNRGELEKNIAAAVDHILRAGS